MVIDNICRVLACGTSILGFVTYRCSCLNCSHTKRICHSCNCRFCNTCGAKRTKQWIEAQ
ncbi:MAG: transposase zinc-binding domain-containing protein [Gammaproteobacteria bacterium]|nr:transposase zinc-binding domain-containing protein [Gammaproteobacteria bacterium]